MAQAKRAKKTRTAEEFSAVSLMARLRPPRNNDVWAWDLETIAAARNDQLRGHFRMPAKLAAMVKSDGAISTAITNRLAPHRGLPVELQAQSASVRARRIRDEAEALFGPEGFAITPDTVYDINEQLANHGVAFATNTFTPRADGSRVDCEVHAWPIEFVRWDPHCRTFKTQTEGGDVVDICHGDGRWIVVRQGELAPWQSGAIVPVALIWADRAYGIRDRSRTGTSHGNAKMIGELPPGLKIDSEEGAAFLLFLESMHGALPYGIRPAGSKTEMLVNTSTAWQIFKEIIESAGTDAARVYLGQDASVRDAGGNYIKSKELFGVRNDIVEGDLRAMERAIFTGAIQPWAALNFGTSDLAPYRRWLMPDADSDARRASIAERRGKLWEDIKSARESGCVVDQEYVDALAAEYGVSAPRLKAVDPAVPAPAPQGETGSPAREASSRGAAGLRALQGRGA